MFHFTSSTGKITQYCVPIMHVLCNLENREAFECGFRAIKKVNMLSGSKTSRRISSSNSLSETFGVRPDSRGHASEFPGVIKISALQTFFPLSALHKGGSNRRAIETLLQRYDAPTTLHMDTLIRQIYATEQQDLSLFGPSDPHQSEVHVFNDLLQQQADRDDRVCTELNMLQMRRAFIAQDTILEYAGGKFDSHCINSILTPSAFAIDGGGSERTHTIRRWPLSSC